MHAWLVGAALVLSGCDQLFGILSFDDPRDAGNPAVDSLASADCKDPVVIDDFAAGGALCGSWALPAANGGLITRDGQLHLTPSADQTNNEMGCDGQVPRPFANGVYVQVAQVIGASGYTVLNALTPAGDAAGTQISVARNLISLYAANDYNNALETIPYESTAMAWWRLRPDTAHGAIVAETSPDGIAWTPFHTYAPPGGVPPAVLVGLGAGMSAPDQAPGTAAFDNLGYCQ